MGLLFKGPLRTMLESQRVQLSSQVIKPSRNPCGAGAEGQSDEYLREPHAIGQDFRDPSSLQFSVAEGLEALEAAEDCRICAPEYRRRTSGANLRILFDSIENGTFLYGVLTERLSLKSVPPALRRTNA